MRRRTSSRSANMGWKCRRRRRNKGRATGKKQRRRTIVVLLLARAGRGENYGKKRSRCVSRHDVLPPTTMIIMCLECCLPLAVSVFGSQVVGSGEGTTRPSSYLAVAWFLSSELLRACVAALQQQQQQQQQQRDGRGQTDSTSSYHLRSKRQPCAPRRPSP